MMLAILNGAFRAKVLIPRVGELAGHVISSITLSAVILAVAWLTISWIHPTTPAQAALVGFKWLGLTLLFEFGVGHYVFRQPWGKLLADYNLAKGRVWMIVLVVTAEAPLLAAKIRGLIGT
jgi:hypothetical protein